MTVTTRYLIDKDLHGIHDVEYLYFEANDKSLTP